MTNASKPRMLAVLSDRKRLTRLREALGAGENGSADRLPLPATLHGLTIDVADDAEGALTTCREAREAGKPIDLVLVDLLDSGQSAALEMVVELWEEDETLPLILLVDETGRPAARGYITRKLRRLDRFHVMPADPSPDELRRVAALQLERRRLLRQSQAIERELQAERVARHRAKLDQDNAVAAKNEFLANVSHEIRTPMNAILGFSRMLLKEPLAEAHLEKLRYVHDASESLLELISNVLDYSKLCAGELKLGRAPLEIDAVVDDVLATVGKTALHKGLAVDYFIEQSVPRRLLGDRTRLRQLLVNLASNAVKFTEEGGIHIRVSRDEDDAESVVLRITVSDTGQGIPADRQAVIFDSFVQADGSSTRRHGGLGLGLAICKQVVDLMGGQIGFRSTEGAGSSFWVTLPMGVPAAAATNDRTSRGGNDQAAARCGRAGRALADESGHGPNHPAGPASPARCRRVLVAEDDQLSRTMVEMLLGRAGCVIDLASTGREAVAAAEGTAYHLVLMDVDMPETDGLQAIRQIRQNEKETGRHTPILAVTAMAMPGDEQRCLDAGADGYLPKPVAPDTLLAAAHRLLPGGLEPGGDVAEQADASSKRTQPRNDHVTAGLVQEHLHCVFQAANLADFQRLEKAAADLKRVVSRLDKRALTDHAMRVQLAARGGDLQSVGTAVRRLKTSCRAEDLLETEEDQAALAGCHHE